MFERNRKRASQYAEVLDPVAPLHDRDAHHQRGTLTIQPDFQNNLSQCAFRPARRGATRR